MALSFQEDFPVNEVPLQSSSSTLPFAASKAHRNQGQTSQSVSGSLERIETHQEGLELEMPELTKSSIKRGQQDQPERDQPDVLEKPVEPVEIRDPSPKLRYETAMVHMSDCPTIRSDCVSSNQGRML